ncbi:MAG: tyrosine-type recombinase/integrase [Bacteroidetes bacterium]|nr:tyrosine-type recombinase/integrase [Bacteroidota bacterium]
MKTIQVEEGIVNSRRRLLLYFAYDKETIAIIRTIPGARWEPAMKCWHIGFTQANLNKILNIFSNNALLNLDGLKHQLTNDLLIRKDDEKLFLPLPVREADQIESLVRWMEHRRYSSSTIRTYSEILSIFLRFTLTAGKDSTLNELVVKFTNEYILKKRLSQSYQNQFINALKLFCREVTGQEVEVEQVERPRREYRLPNVLSRDEVKALLLAMKNIKHHAMLSLIYGCGLRRSELLNLKLVDVDSRRGLLIIRQAKGKKDRIVPVSEKLISMLREYYKNYRPKVWLFEGVVRGQQYDERSLQQVLKKSLLLSGIKKPVTLHWLRHSYATHLHESGVDIRYIQELLGHRSSRTTEIYTHVSARSIQSIRSPFDDL